MKKIWLKHKNKWNWKQNYYWSCHDKYIITQELNKLTSENFSARLAQANLTNKIDASHFVKKTDFGDKQKSLNKNALNELSKKVKVISTKGLTRHQFCTNFCWS